MKWLSYTLSFFPEFMEEENMYEYIDSPEHNRKVNYYVFSASSG